MLYGLKKLIGPFENGRIAVWRIHTAAGASTRIEIAQAVIANDPAAYMFNTNLHAPATGRTLLYKIRLLLHDRISFYRKHL